MEKMIFFTYAYNAQKTVARTIESVLSQTYTDFEYVIIDNGSKDRTGEIIDSYAKSDSRMMPIHRKDNLMTNISYTYMPLLIKEAQGGYLSWIDADDEYDKNYFKKMYTFVKDNGLSVACCGTVMCSPDNQFRLDKPEKTAIFESKGFADNISIYYKYVTRLWANLYSTKLLEPNMFPSCSEKGSSFYDAMIPLSVYNKAPRAGVLSECLHRYHVSSSQLSCCYNPKFYWWICKVTDYLRDYLESYGPLNEKSENFIWQRFFVWLVYAINMLKRSEADAITKLNDITAMLESNRTKTLFNKDWITLGILTAKSDFLSGLLEYAEKMGTVCGCKLVATKLITIIKKYSEEE